ncbi:MAG: NUDIX domain-containing protein [Chloroflexota bacterium]|nr:NUDIX domain-containing protein [Chloroflexota bacterium]
MEREFTVAVFVVHQGAVLLHWHRRLQRWLPPGGHVDPGELPDEAAVRETREETGLAVELLDAPGGAPALGRASETPLESPRRLTRPLGIQLEDIAPGHQHIDLIYVAQPAPSANPVSGDQPDTVLRAEAGNPHGRPGWFTPAEWRALPVTAEIDSWATAAVATLVDAAAPPSIGYPGVEDVR